MIVKIEIEGALYSIDLSRGFDLSIGISSDGVRAFYAPAPVLLPVKNG